MAITIKKDEQLKKWFDYSEDESYQLVFHSEVNYLNFADAINAMCNDWKGVFDEKNKPLKCVRENKISFLSTQEGQIRFAWMLSKCSNLNDFWNVEEIKKNLPRS